MTTQDITENTERGPVEGNQTAATVQTLYEQLNEYHAQKNANQNIDNAYYEQNVEAIARDNVPSDIPIYESSLATDTVDQVSEALRTDEGKVIYDALTSSDSEMKKKSRLEAWGRQVLSADGEDRDIDPYAQAGIDLALRGEAVIKRLHRTDMPIEPAPADFKGKGRQERFDGAHKQWEALMEATSPLLPAVAVDPLNVFIPPNATNPLPYIVEYQERRQIDLWEQYPDWKAELAAKVLGEDKNTLTEEDLNNPMRIVTWLEYWSTTQYIIVADGVEVVNKANPYGFVPYAHEYSGIGRAGRDGTSDKKAASIISKIRGELKSDIVMRTIMYELAQSYVFPRIRIPEGRETAVREGMGHRGILTYDENDPRGPDSIQWLDPVPINPAVSEFMARTQEAVARRVNPILGGMPQQDAEFGVLEALRLGQATKGIQKIGMNLNRLATHSLHQASQMLIALDKKMTVFGTSQNGGSKFNVTDAMLKEFKHLSVKFEAIDPVEQTRQQQAGMVLLRGGAITKRTYRSKYLPEIVEDALSEEIQEAKEMAFAAFSQSPEFMQWATQQHMAKMQQQQTAEAQTTATEQLQQMAASAGPGAGGVAASAGSTMEALAGGGATTADRQQASEALGEMT